MQGIGAVGYVKNKPQPSLINTTPSWQSFTGIRQAIADKLGATLKNTKNIGIIKALTIGVRHEISQQKWDVLRKTGVVHLLTISGLHIGFIAGLGYFLVHAISVRLNIESAHKIAAIFAILSAFFYATLAGFSLPTQRAVIMLSIAMTFLILQRNITSIKVLSLALASVLLFNPLVVMSPSFWLSFLAITLIIYCLSGRIGYVGYWKNTIKIHLVTATGLMPLLFLYFQQASIIAPLANFFMIPIISFIVVPLCLLGVPLLFLSTTLAHGIFTFVDTILQYLLQVLSAIAKLPFATLTLSSPTFYAITLALMGIFILFSPRGIPFHKLGLVLLLPLLFSEHKKPKSAEVTMTLLDVGQGLSAVIETKNHVLIYDTGSKYSKNYDMGSAVVLPFLRSKGINNIDTLLISHGDNDHIGGAKTIITNNTVQKILIGGKSNLLKQYAPKLCQAGQTWIWDKVEFTILSPVLNTFKGRNNNSCVLKIKANQRVILLTGDIEKPAEDWLVSNYASKLKSDLLIAPHHGSNTSSSWQFLQQVKPSTILIASGYHNRFAFPHQKVLKRYKTINAKTLNTAYSGALIVKIKQNSVTVNSFRSEHGKYWNK